MKKIFAIIFSALAGLALYAGPAGVDVKKKHCDELTVISYNVRLVTPDDGDNQWKYRAPATPAMIKDYCPDIFGVQEAVLEQLEYMDKHLPNYSYVGVGRENGKQRGETMAIFYNTKRVKLLDWGTYWLSETPDVPSRGWDAACRRTVTWTLMEMKDSGRRFFYVNTHLDHVSTDAQDLGGKLIAEKAEEIKNKYVEIAVVITGDFNQYPDGLAIKALEEKGFVKASDTVENGNKIGTYHGWGKVDETAPIDFIFTDESRKISNYKVHSEKIGKSYVSDHFMITAEVEM